jgi:hypothetical protein
LACVVCGGGAGVAEEPAVPAGPYAAGAKFPGPTETGFLLPNGWHLTPAGRQIETGDLVLNIRPLADGKRALVTCDGFNEHRLMLVDLDAGAVLDEESAHQSWFGLDVSEDESRVWWSGGDWGGSTDSRSTAMTSTSLPSASPIRSR